MWLSWESGEIKSNCQKYCLNKSADSQYLTLIYNNKSFGIKKSDKLESFGDFKA